MSLIRIGDFSQLAQVSTRALRLYDELGLLTPNRIEKVTGYRFYSLDQLPRLNRILALKDLGFSLEQISTMLSDDLSVEHGIGSWTDAEIARAIRSGVSKDGQQLHWQGMIWDHFSNMDEEDVRAVIAYVRLLPPVNREVPKPAPPSANDCDEYVIFLMLSNTPGCSIK